MSEGEVGSDSDRSELCLGLGWWVLSCRIPAFASGHHVAKMRDLLLEHGAEETEEDRECWRICEKAWLCENIRLREARMLDSRDYDPIGAAAERDM